MTTVGNFSTKPNVLPLTLRNNSSVGQPVLQNPVLPRISEYSSNQRPLEINQTNYLQGLGMGQILSRNNSTGRVGNFAPVSKFYSAAPLTAVNANQPASRRDQPVSNIRQQSPKVYATSGYALPSGASSYRPLDSLIRPTKTYTASQAVPANKIITTGHVSGHVSTVRATPAIKTVLQTQYFDGDTAYQTVNSSNYDQERQKRKKLYESTGYTEKKKLSPCLLACLGLLLLAGLLAGLFFLIRSINVEIGVPRTQKSANINIKSNTNANAPVNPHIVTPEVLQSSSVIDADTNPMPIRTSQASINPISVAPIAVSPNTTNNLFTTPPSFITPITSVETDTSSDIGMINRQPSVSVSPSSTPTVSHKLQFEAENHEIRQSRHALRRNHY